MECYTLRYPKQVGTWRHAISEGTSCLVLKQLLMVLFFQTNLSASVRNLDPGGQIWFCGNNTRMWAFIVCAGLVLSEPQLRSFFPYKACPGTSLFTQLPLWWSDKETKSHKSDINSRFGKKRPSPFTFSLNDFNNWTIVGLTHKPETTGGGGGYGGGKAHKGSF